MRMTHPLVHTPGNDEYYYGAHNRSTYNWKPLIRHEAKASHNADACRHEEKAKVMHQKIGKFIDLRQFDDTAFKRRSQCQHPDYARRHRYARKHYNEFSQRKKREQNSTLKYHNS